jgi:predicted PurR-regulated permease PerM
MRDETRQPAPNYINACIVMFGVNLTWILLAVWALWGFLVALILGVALNHLMTRLEERALARAAADRANPRARGRS